VVSFCPLGFLLSFLYSELASSPLPDAACIGGTATASLGTASPCVSMVGQALGAESEPIHWRWN